LGASEHRGYLPGLPSTIRKEPGSFRVRQKQSSEPSGGFRKPFLRSTGFSADENGEGVEKREEREEGQQWESAEGKLLLVTEEHELRCVRKGSP